MGYIGRYTAPSIVDLESPVSVDGTTIIENGVLKNVGIDGIKLKSSGNSITKSDGTTAVLSESGGVVTLNNGTIGSGVVFPALGNSAVGTVSESSGTPTGDIIERGSNSNGQFVKYADGTLICTRTYGAGNTSTIGSFGTFTFPATFSNLDGISFTCRASTSGSPEPYVYFYTNPNTTTYEPRVFSSGTYTTFRMIAFGRWY